MLKKYLIATPLVVLATALNAMEVYDQRDRLKSDLAKLNGFGAGFVLRYSEDISAV